MYNPNRRMGKSWLFYFLIRKEFIKRQICLGDIFALNWFIDKVKLNSLNKK